MITRIIVVFFSLVVLFSQIVNAAPKGFTMNTGIGLSFDDTLYSVGTDMGFVRRLSMVPAISIHREITSVLRRDYKFDIHLYLLVGYIIHINGARKVRIGALIIKVKDYLLIIITGMSHSLMIHLMAIQLQELTITVALIAPDLFGTIIGNAGYHKL